MINTEFILPHLVLTFCSLFIGLYIFFLSSKNFDSIKLLSYVYCVILFMGAVTGLLLNTKNFSPFHFLSVVTIITIPLAIYQLSQGDRKKYLGGLFYNFLGLTIAFTGALEPSRTVGYRLWIKTLNLELQFAENIFLTLFIVSTIIATVLVVLVIKNKFKLLK